MLEIDLTTIENSCRLHINNAAASLESQSEKYAMSGLLSAATAAGLTEIVLKTPNLTVAEETRFRSLSNQANKLIDSYWADFKLVLRASGASEPKVRENGHVEAEKIVRKTWTRKGIDPEKRNRIRDLVNNIPSGVSKTEWMQQIADDEGVGTTTVYRISRGQYE